MREESKHVMGVIRCKELFLNWQNVARHSSVMEINERRWVELKRKRQNFEISTIAFPRRLNSCCVRVSETTH